LTERNDRGNAGIAVCRFEDLESPESREFDSGTPDAPRSGFVVREGDAVYAYLNVCPHAGHRLNWKPHAFLTRRGDLIMCSMHGAIFDIHTGVCVGGPCEGRALTPLRVAVEAGDVVVFPDE
jgi:nitrite reductase/ring-hydroxylating ferredoxin subunit